MDVWTAWTYGCLAPTAVGSGYLLAAWRLYPVYFWHAGMRHLIVWQLLMLSGLFFFFWHLGPAPATYYIDRWIPVYLARFGLLLVVYGINGLPFLVWCLVRYLQQQRTVKQYYRDVALEQLKPDLHGVDLPGDALPGDDTHHYADEGREPPS